MSPRVDKLTPWQAAKNMVILEDLIPKNITTDCDY